MILSDSSWHPNLLDVSFAPMKSHDQITKQLLQLFFVDFLAAFLPDLHRDLEVHSVQFLDKELIRARRAFRRTKLVDLVVRVRFRGEESFILIHIEHQGRRDPKVARRMFLYAAWLMDRYDLPVYPVLVTSYDRPLSPEPAGSSWTCAGCACWISVSAWCN